MSSKAGGSVSVETAGSPGTVSPICYFYIFWSWVEACEAGYARMGWGRVGMGVGVGVGGEGGWGGD